MSPLQKIFLSLLIGVAGFLVGRKYEQSLPPATSAPSPAVFRTPSSDVCGHSATAFHCVRFISNADGDTIKVEIPMVHPLFGKRISVRVRGVDTAEMKGKSPCERDKALIAKHLVRQALISANRIDLVDVGRDKYFRILADVVADGTSLKRLLLQRDLAYEYDGKTKTKVDWCARGKN